uniref:Uncharacterized protein n=1 Tax=Chromera velia CCMP2878 TaxID=1169474 RepID=A0A0G4IG35_9ALVE|eukprot:Cvel_14177.t1-p1 / transcript=Cvel_14177.t1 / gene=Cvel_14177 / organism=Chromera_velia_CCMP2878 / gene_product=hypothetical protein / transcript_product=hypothetical protein / location=Cvel_scaffold999:40304-42265(-) / protein_length=502 / sequence_SO=supercontig / SO=protein_coding / is_pseudo=false
MARLDEATEAVLQHVMGSSSGDRAYVFHFRGCNLHNSHEVTTSEADPFQEKLESITCDDLPVFSSEIRHGRRVVVHDKSELDPVAASRELEEMTDEDISQLVLVPVTAQGQEGHPIVGFVGVDRCGRRRLDWKGAVIGSLQTAGRFLFALHSFSELVTGQPLLPFDSHPYIWAVPPTPAYREKAISQLWGVLTASELFQHVASYVTHTPVIRQPTALPPLPEDPLEIAASHFKKHRYAILDPEVWGADESLNDFRSKVLAFVHTMEPDIEPYTHFRNVGYARYAYRDGTILPLLHKPFFQVDPSANVLLRSTPRPFSRLDDATRHHPGLMRILQVLLEKVWDHELGPQVHIAVHPVLVRNYHEGALHTQAYSTYEGTHVDSTMRVAVILLGRQNVKAGTATTSLYHSSCPIGKQRFVSEDEAHLAPLRLAEVTLTEPLQAITFDDCEFKHDASNPEPEDPSEPMWRSVLLVMCRVPCTERSPLDDHAVDGGTPRSLSSFCCS